MSALADGSNGVSRRGSHSYHVLTLGQLAGLLAEAGIIPHETFTLLFVGLQGLRVIQWCHDHIVCVA